MNRKGFTLIELLGVIIILAVLFLIITPTITDLLMDSKDRMFTRNVNTILSGANDWAIDNAMLLPSEQDQKINITLGQLKQGGYVNSNIKNPKSGDLFNNDMIITITNIGSTAENKKIEYSKYNGDYLFVVDLESGSDISVYDEDMPSIVLTGDIVTYVQLNEEYIEPGYTAVSKSNVDLTDLVTLEIRSNNEVLNNITTTNFKTYEIYYTVNDGDKSTTVTRTVIITDTKEPVIDIPTINVIDLSVKEFDYLEGVTCTDNSGDCDISYEGEVKLGVKGKYVITYKCIDASGNTATKKRVITIK